MFQYSEQEEENEYLEVTLMNSEVHSERTGRTTLVSHVIVRIHTQRSYEDEKQEKMV